MRIAITYDPETGMVAEHFGHAEYFKLYTEDDGVVFTDVVASPANGHSGVTAFLASQGVDAVSYTGRRAGRGAAGKPPDLRAGHELRLPW